MKMWMNVPLIPTVVTSMLSVQTQMDHLHVHAKVAFLEMVQIVQVDRINLFFKCLIIGFGREL